MGCPKYPPPIVSLVGTPPSRALYPHAEPKGVAPTWVAARITLNLQNLQNLQSNNFIDNFTKFTKHDKFGINLG